LLQQNKLASTFKNKGKLLAKQALLTHLTAGVQIYRT